MLLVQTTVVLYPMHRFMHNLMIPLRSVPRQRRLRLPMLRVTRGALALAGIALALLIWQSGAFWAAILVGASSVLTGAAGMWWQWATSQSPPRRPTLFVVRHRQQQTLRLMRSVEVDLTRNIAIVETLVRQVEDLSVAADVEEGAEVKGYENREQDEVACGAAHFS